MANVIQMKALDGVVRFFDAQTGEVIPGCPVGKCPRCGCGKTEDGHDACIGKVPGVVDACCGHGNRDGYLLWPDGVKMHLPRR